MTQILALRTAIVERLREALPGIDVQAHPRATFGPKDLDACLRNRWIAIRVMFRGVLEEGTKASSNQTDVPEAWGLVIAAKDGKKTPADLLPRDEKILSILPTVLATIAADGFLDEDDEDDVLQGLPHGIRVEEIYAGDEDGAANSAMVWGVVWNQLACIPAGTPDDLRDFLTLVTHYDLAPGDGTDEASDTIPLPQEDP